MENANIQELATAALNEFVSTGKVQDLVKIQVEKLIEESIKDAFKSYGDIGKQIKEGIMEAVKIDFSTVSLPEYNHIIVDVISKATHDHLKAEAHSYFIDSLKKSMHPAPTETTVQDVVNCYLEGWNDDDYQNMDRSAIVELEQHDYGWFNLKIWQGKKESYSGRSSSADVDLHVNKEGVIRIMHHTNTKLGTSHYEGDAAVYQMYVAKTIITDISTCEVDYLETSFGPQYD